MGNDQERVVGVEPVYTPEGGRKDGSDFVWVPSSEPKENGNDEAEPQE